LKRTMAHADALARPVDCFDRPLPATWLVTATNGGVRRDVIGLFNYATNLMPVDYSCDRLGLAAGKEYYAFDFWADAPLPPFAEQFTSPVPARSCRVIAVRANEGHPVVVSTSRHVTQGMLDVAEEKWAAAGQTLSGVSRVIGGDAYELRIAGVGTGRVISAAVSEADRAAGVTISVRPAVAGEAGWARVVVNAPADRAVAWAIGFGS